ncbi:type-2 histone deacetylase 2-like [Ostrinia nubilalis]|uniref:type-2 histone deacetylase 2-like n=1 Tax=Ostrinia nubilalis TaxID=29057 RepID=UPI0030822638
MDKEVDEEESTHNKNDNIDEIIKEKLDEFLIAKENQSVFEDNDDKHKYNETAEEKNYDKNEEENAISKETFEEKNKSGFNENDINDTKNYEENQSSREIDDERDKDQTDDEERDIEKGFLASNEDFSSGSGDGYVPNSESSDDKSSIHCPPKKRNRAPVTINESGDTSSLSESLLNVRKVEEEMVDAEEEKVDAGEEIVDAEEKIVDTAEKAVEDNLEDPGTSGNKTDNAYCYMWPESTGAN